MSFNSKCIADVLLYIDDNKNFRHDGRMKPLRGRSILHDSRIAATFTNEEIRSSLEYLCRHKMLVCADLSAKTSTLQIDGITSKGAEYVQALRNPVRNAAKDFVLTLFAENAPAAVGVTLKKFMK